jgi:HAD superfamily hydrolase (TIGR01509 family)
MQKIELVIFDCDGVLVDSEIITNRVFASMLNELGLPVTLDDMFEKFVGRSMAYSLEIIEASLGRNVPENFVHEYQTRIEAALKSELKAVPGIESALESINVPYCVASSGSHEKMRATLGITGLLPKFEERLFSATDVAKGKPAPDVFLYAARKLGTPPAACAVVEDTPIGVAAGVAAGMSVYGYAAHTPARQLEDAGAHFIFSSMSELPSLLRDAIQGT